MVVRFSVHQIAASDKGAAALHMSFVLTMDHTVDDPQQQVALIYKYHIITVHFETNTQHLTYRTALGQEQSDSALAEMSK